MWDVGFRAGFGTGSVLPATTLFAHISTRRWVSELPLKPEPTALKALSLSPGHPRPKNHKPDLRAIGVEPQLP